MERRLRLFIECVRKLSNDPLAAPSAKGTPIGDGCGMEGLVAQIAPLFEKERSLLRWVALRGALSHLYVMTVDSSSRAFPFLPVVEVAMGVGDVSATPGTGDPDIDVAPEWASRLSPEQRTGVVGLFTSLVSRLFDYENYSNMAIDEVNDLPQYRVVNDAIALDYIAWSAVALHRTGLAQHILTAPEPDALESPGWYTDPLWAKAERYWDGTDWTEWVGISNGQVVTSRLRPVAQPGQPGPAAPAAPASSAGPAGPPGPAGSVGPTVGRILAEWTIGQPTADMARWREGMARYDAAPLENRPEMRASAELMCAGLTHYLRGDDFISDGRGNSGELLQTIWNVLVASLAGNDQTTWDGEVERHMRLALAAARKASLQPEALGGRGTFDQIFDDRGNQMLMMAALWEMHISGPKSFSLHDWFLSEPEDAAWKVP
jgi:hypothetical protein